MNEKSSLIPYRLISEQRFEIMGFAILWVVFFHSSVAVDIQPFSLIKDVGYGGVDIFLFLSGMGIWQSLSKHSASVFFKNRLNRIIPTWWSYLLVCVVIGYIHTGLKMSFQEIIAFTTFTGFWLQLPNQGNWYVYAIMLFYAISPLLFSLIQDSNRKMVTGLFLIAVTMIASLSGRGASILGAMIRLPIYIAGMLFSAVSRKLSLDRKKLLILAGIFIFGSGILSVLYLSLPLDYLIDTGLCWYPFFLIAPPLTILLAMLFDMTAKHANWINRILQSLGKASLEILLAADYILKWTGDWIDYGTVSAILAILGVFVGVFYHLVIEKVKTCYLYFYNKRNRV